MSLARYTDGSSSLLKATKHDVEIMLKFRPKHPLTLQSARLLAQFLQKPEVPLKMMEGTLSAMHQYSDPAQALQHLLHCMYAELMVCTQSSWHVLSAHGMYSQLMACTHSSWRVLNAHGLYSDPAQAVLHLLHCMYSELTMCTHSCVQSSGMNSELMLCTQCHGVYAQLWYELGAQRMYLWDVLSAHGMYSRAHGLFSVLMVCAQSSWYGHASWQPFCSSVQHKNHLFCCCCILVSEFAKNW